MNRTEQHAFQAENGMEGLILAGGKGRRLGGLVKGLLPVAGIPLIQIIANEMQRVCDSTGIAVADPEQATRLHSFANEIYMDRIPGRGPLAAVSDAFIRARQPAVWISACDMPLVSSCAALYMNDRRTASGVQAAVPWIGGKLHPLQAVYSPECQYAAKHCLQQEEFRMMSFLQRIRFVSVTEEEFAAKGIDIRFVTNINTSEDYACWEPMKGE
ncbi:molybdenum cofactor guanylyltransferase [Paenibacillus gansuensis]|uniref:Probable molybdenum cofactor guanylyltransferase n=1 Tax=Paenibacillus gansuensis TaxID=306542 RepID=A0ABW5PJQ8_9BACL